MNEMVRKITLSGVKWFFSEIKIALISGEISLASKELDSSTDLSTINGSLEFSTETDPRDYYFSA